MSIHGKYLKSLPEGTIDPKLISFINDKISQHIATIAGSIDGRYTVETGPFIPDDQMIILYVDTDEKGFPSGFTGLCKIPHTLLDGSEREYISGIESNGVNNPFELCRLISSSEADEETIYQHLPYIPAYLLKHAKELIEQIARKSAEGMATCLLITKAMLSPIPIGSFLSLEEAKNES
jgi:hypothetical protein